MVTDTNPFQPPALENVRIAKRSSTGWLQHTLLIVWPFIFGANMIIPLLVGWDMIAEDGAIGAGIASLLLLLLGWALFYVWPAFATRMSVGAILTAILQVFPIVHFIFGLIAFGITVELGQAIDISDDSGPGITTELGGFLITSLMGLMLLLLSLGFGVLIFFVVNWRKPMVGNESSRDPERQ
jgi:hypothetical protein